MKKLNYEAKFDLEKWYPFIQEETFKSEILDFSKEEAEAFVEFYSKPLKENEKFNVKNNKIITELENKLDSHIQKILKNSTSNCSGVFVRLGPSR
jgi:predicted RNA-binding protein Jag